MSLKTRYTYAPKKLIWRDTYGGVHELAFQPFYFYGGRPANCNEVAYPSVEPLIIV
jgi:hypothetical protein